MNAAIDIQLQALIARVTSPSAQQRTRQSVQLPDQLNSNDPAKRAQTGLFEESDAIASNSLENDSKVVLACFGEVVVFQRIWVDVAGCFEYGVVLSHLLSAIQEAGQKSEADGFVELGWFMVSTERKTGIPYQDIEDALFVMDANKQLILWQLKEGRDDRCIGINTTMLLKLLKTVVLNGSDAHPNPLTGVLG